ncbi:MULTISPECIES: histidine phosphatase family protein [unclassified Mycobacterium]|uniref:histidine phosphatase family protein n=1 Tax=unclassified Mycobacterium TaxID=2642494 RepID=UPI003875B19C
MQASHVLSLTASAALAGGIAVVPVAASSPPAAAAAFDIQLTAQDIVIDFVRHAEMISPYENMLTPSPDHPGAPLSELGQEQASDVGNQLYSELGQVAGLFTGQGLRVTETAAPFAELVGMTPQLLPQLDEVDSGIYALDPIESLGGRLGFLTVGGWTLGAPLGLALLSAPGSHDANGIVMGERFDDGVQTMYDHALANSDVISDNGQVTDVAFTSTASIFTWVMQNVDNPDLPFFLNLIKEANSVPNGQTTIFLPNTAVVEVEGNPTDGWKLVSWDGHAIAENPDLLSALFVDVRDVMLPAQAALWHTWEAILGGDPTTIMNAMQTGFDDVGSALVQFPGSVFTDIVDAIGNLG